MIIIKCALYMLGLIGGGLALFFLFCACFAVWDANHPKPEPPKPSPRLCFYRYLYYEMEQDWLQCKNCPQYKDGDCKGD